MIESTELIPMIYLVIRLCAQRAACHYEVKIETQTYGEDLPLLVKMPNREIPDLFYYNTHDKVLQDDDYYKSDSYEHRHPHPSSGADQDDLERLPGMGASHQQRRAVTSAVFFFQKPTSKPFGHWFG